MTLVTYSLGFILFCLCIFFVSIMVSFFTGYCGNVDAIDLNMKQIKINQQ